jgi:hypothetical protein
MGHVLWSKHPGLERWVGLREVERIRLEALGRPPAERRRLAAVAGEIDAWEHRALNLAELYDDAGLPEVEVLLLPLFQHAYLRGFARAYLGEEAAAGVAAATLCSEVVPAVREYAGQLAHLGLPCPQADLGALLGIGSG